ncbi:OmpA family protein [Chitinophaga ginsengisoli]|uniref:Outer membrane protein OmpA-like peptidoglycan-associated protein n=1 Tax=Chitinophaga ginsengisoli TaxID=363837 RepID=A0A2P8G6Y8_9BACT|nr:OmpA family protein [Chitinophaga ginsengisoli]PSL29750.1 outer membrane protein OmpA-like peptidoglycan-associated protein [Chitinophaga ginsengisoli]
MKKLFLTVIGLAVMQLAWAQHKASYLRAADSYYKQADYYSASLYYEKFLAVNTKGNTTSAYSPYAAPGGSAKIAPAADEIQAAYQLADSYRRLHDPVKAAPLFGKVVAADSTRFPLAAYYYGESLRAIAQYDAAASAFKTFLSQYNQKDTYSVTAEQELRNLSYIREQLQKKELSDYHIRKAPSVLNAGGATYAPVWAGDQLLFTSTKESNYVNRIYMAKDTVAAAISKANITQPSKTHQGAISVSADGNTLYLTQWTVADGKKSAAIYTSRKEGDKWSEPVKLSDVVNATGTNTQQPFVMADGHHLLFASDRAGGSGGYDLYSAELDASGKPLAVQNLGPTINTSANEEAPFFHPASGTLVFASDGRTGMGGFDLYYAKGSLGKWDAPVNFGYPVNDVKDDMYFFSRSKSEYILEDAWFSSDRSAECCLELFSLHLAPPPPPVKEEPVVIVTKPAPTLADTILSAPVNTAITMQEIYYELNEFEVTPASHPALDKLVELLNGHPQMEIEISAHTDNTGSAAFNQRLSEKRALNCVAYLVSKGINKKRLQYKGYGATRPVAPNTLADGSDNPEGRRLNRRIELKILKQ